MYNEHGTSTPLIFSINGGLSREKYTFYSRVAQLLSVKLNSTKVKPSHGYEEVQFNQIVYAMFVRNHKMTDQNQIFDSDIKDIKFELDSGLNLQSCS